MSGGTSCGVRQDPVTCETAGDTVDFLYASADTSSDMRCLVGGGTALAMLPQLPSCMLPAATLEVLGVANLIISLPPTLIALTGIE